MRKITIIFYFISILTYCQQRKDKANSPGFFEKSLKEQKDRGTITEYIEHFDSIKNVYSNFKYRIDYIIWKPRDINLIRHVFLRWYYRKGKTSKVLDGQNFQPTSGNFQMNHYIMLKNPLRKWFVKFDSAISKNIDASYFLSLAVSKLKPKSYFTPKVVSA